MTDVSKVTLKVLAKFADNLWAARDRTDPDSERRLALATVAECMESALLAYDAAPAKKQGEADMSVSSIIDDEIIEAFKAAQQAALGRCETIHCDNDHIREGLSAALPMIGEKLAKDFTRTEQTYVPDVSAIDVRLSWQARPVWPNGNDIAARIRELTRKP